MAEKSAFQETYVRAAGAVAFIAIIEMMTAGRKPKKDVELVCDAYVEIACVDYGNDVLCCGSVHSDAAGT
jgi:hypothetical protein